MRQQIKDLVTIFSSAKFGYNYNQMINGRETIQKVAFETGMTELVKYLFLG